MACWEEQWIATAEHLIRDKFTNSYMNIEANNDIGIVETISEKEMGTKVHMLIISLWLWLTQSIIYQGYQHVQQPSRSCPPPKAANLGLEISHYLSSGIKHVTDLFKAWWHAQCGSTYPQLSHMALNYLSIPGKFF